MPQALYVLYLVPLEPMERALCPHFTNGEPEAQRSEVMVTSEPCPYHLCNLSWPPELIRGPLPWPLPTAAGAPPCIGPGLQPSDAQPRVCRTQIWAGLSALSPGASLPGPARACSCWATTGQQALAMLLENPGAPERTLLSSPQKNFYHYIMGGPLPHSHPQQRNPQQNKS